MPILSVSDAVGLIVPLVIKVYQRLEALSHNDELRQRIERKIKELQNVADQLKRNDISDFPPACQDCLQKFKVSLDTCKNICDTISGTGSLRKFVDVHSHKSQLHTLESELQSARDSLQLAFTTTIIAQNQELHRRVEEGTSRVEATVVHPDAGVYRGGSATTKLSKPCQIEKPHVTLEKDLMIVSWNDRKNSALEVDSYEVRCDDEAGPIVASKPDEIRSSKDTAASCFSVTLGYPKVQVGRVYTIRVRATNGKGPGEWSRETVVRLNIGPPNKPPKPTITVISPTEVHVHVQRLKEKDENGSKVHEVSVEYISTEDTNASEWQTLRCPLKPRQVTKEPAKFSIKSLTPDSAYMFRVRMVNEAGESPPSVATEVLTTQLIPGPPQNLRISSKRTDTTIKVRWNQPDENPHVACKYEVQICPASKRKSPTPEWNTFAVTEADKLSATADELETDTKYDFRVRAINNKGEGKYTDSVQAETRYGIFGRTVAAVGATLGGTVGGPVIGATGLGYMAGSAARESADGKAGKAVGSIAAGVGAGVGGALLGTLGAPLFGAMAGVLTYKGMAGEIGDISPQSSDDEEESTLNQLWRMSQKKAEDIVNQ